MYIVSFNKTLMNYEYGVVLPTWQSNDFARRTGVSLGLPSNRFGFMITGIHLINSQSCHFSFSIAKLLSPWF